MLATVILQIALCIIIIGGYFLAITRDTSSQTTSETTILTVISMAIAVWIGLNIYNVISKEELQDLHVMLNNAQESVTEVTKVTKQVYMEMLKSKFRMSAVDTASEYFSLRLEEMELLPIELSERILKLEDIFQISYHLYGYDSSSSGTDEGARLAENLQKTASEYKRSGSLDSEQHTFLMGYTFWRWADFLYYWADCHKENRESIAKEAIKYYMQAAKYLFGVEAMTDFKRKAKLNEYDYKFLAYMANDLVSTYVSIIPGSLGTEEWDDVISVGEAAVIFCKELPNKVRAKIIRNLGCAYERRGYMDKAFEQYKKSYQIDPGNYRTVHCIGSFYRKQAVKFFYPDCTPIELGERNLKDIEYKQIKQLPCCKPLIENINQALYWYTVKQTLNYDQAEPRLIELNNFLYKLTNDDIYRKKAEIHQAFFKEIKEDDAAASPPKIP